MSLDDDSNEPGSASAAAAASSQPTVNDPQLTATLDASLVKQLTDMGFPQLQAEKSLILSKATTAEAAASWLLDHMNDPDINEPLTVVGSSPAPPKPKGNVVDPNVRGAPLGYAAGDVYEDPEEAEGRNLLASIRGGGAGSQAHTRKPVGRHGRRIAEIEEELARLRSKGSAGRTKEDKDTMFDLKREKRRLEMEDSEMSSKIEREKIDKSKRRKRSTLRGSTRNNAQKWKWTGRNAKPKRLVIASVL
eukprot:GABV01000315.1.p1 GENE.GABV01000315.1~~GABV01000315.1.p1  ORF type:complete len:248 (+),score=91.72 GABV01000315.1:664-1407(+)